MSPYRNFWFNRTMDAGRGVGLPQDPPRTGVLHGEHAPAGTGVADSTRRREEEIRLGAKAEALTAAVCVARGYEDRNANAAAVRIALAARADEAWNRLEHHHHTPLEAAEAPPQGPSTSLPTASAASSGTVEPPAGTIPDGLASPPRLRLTANETDPSTGPLDLHEALVRLELIPDAIDAAIEMLETMSRVPGNGVRMQTLSTADFLKTVKAFALGRERVTLPPPEPQSFRVGPPKLTVVNPEGAA